MQFDIGGGGEGLPLGSDRVLEPSMRLARHRFCPHRPRLGRRRLQPAQESFECLLAVCPQV